MAELGQEHRGFAAVLGCVVDLVDHLLPQRVGPALALEVRVGDCPGQLRVGERADKRLRVALDDIPARADGREIGELRGLRHRPRRAPLPALEVEPLGAQRVHERVVNGVEAGAAGLAQLRRRARRGRLHDLRVGPGVVAIEAPHHVREHGDP